MNNIILQNSISNSIIHNNTNRKFKYFIIPASSTSLDNVIDYVINNTNKEDLPQYISLNIQIESRDEEESKTFFTVGRRYPVNLNDLKSIQDCNDYLLAKYDTLSEYYTAPNPVNYYVNYFSLTDAEYNSNKNIFSNTKPKVEIPLGSETPLILPLNVNYYSWGDSFKVDDKGNRIISNLYNSKDLRAITSIKVIYTNAKNRTLELISNNNKIITVFDKIISPSEFIRSFDNKEYHIRNSVPYFFFENKFPHKTISTLKPSKNYSMDFITLDIETYKDAENIMHVYCVSFFDGEASKSFFVNDYDNLDSMLTDLFKTLFVTKNNNKLLFIHNSSMFDLIFLLKHLASYPNITMKPILKDGKFINLSIKYGKNGGFNINLRDSYLLLTSSLAKLCSAFDVKKPKDIFPHRFVTANNLDYVGPVPAFHFFDKISLAEYNEYANRFVNIPWNLKTEAIKYCELDCTSLHNVITNFSIQIFDMFSITLNKCPTLPSLAFRIFRTHYLDKNIKLPVLINDTFKDIFKSYFGGAVDMYIPSNENGKQLYWYDVNSLYPSEMKNNKYPVSLLGHFKGDISNKIEYSSLFTNEENVGFYKVKITAPSIKHPIIPTRLNGRTIFPEGNWTGWYYSEELKNAVRFGYKYEILEGYIFSSATIFDKFVEKLSEMKENAESGSATYLIAKLLMNSLYGKFGMKPILVDHSFIDNNNREDFINKIGTSNVLTLVDIGNKTLMSYNTTFESKYIKINVAIASAVTANARIHMSQFKNNPNFKLYYSDTDSFVTNKPLPEHLVDNKKLGLMKLEKVLTRFVSLGPKIYGGQTLDGNEFVKVKGLKNMPTLDELESKLYKESNELIVKHEKWNRSTIDGHIQIKNTEYKIKVTSNKRSPVYNEAGMLIGTKNLVLTE